MQYHKLVIYSLLAAQFVSRYLDIDQQLQTENPPDHQMQTDDGLQSRVLPVLALNEVSHMLLRIG